MIKLRNKYIHNYLFSKDIQRNYLKRTEKYKPLTIEQLSSLISAFGAFLKVEAQVNTFVEYIKKIQEHLQYATTVFSLATLPKYKNKELLRLVFGGYRSEAKFLGAGKNIPEQFYEVFDTSATMRSDI